MHVHNHTLSDEELFCLEGCRSFKQYFKMRQGFEAKACAFCQLDRTLNKVLWEDARVMVWKVPDDYLRKELKLHALIVPKRHVRFEASLTNAEALSIHRAKKFVRKELGYQGGNTHVREGDMRLNAGTVPHLHINTFEPDPEAVERLAEEERKKAESEERAPEKIEVRIPVFKDPNERAENQGRAATFAARYQAGETP